MLGMIVADFVDGNRWWDFIHSKFHCFLKMIVVELVQKIGLHLKYWNIRNDIQYMFVVYARDGLGKTLP